jgi:hypothetical protein
MNVSNRRVSLLLWLRMRRTTLLAFGLAFAPLALAGCTSSSVNNLIDSLPREVGLPADTPERPATPLIYPAVHDMPPPRPNSTLTAEEQINLENDLTAMRARQDALTGTKPAPQRRTRPSTPPAEPRIIPTSSDQGVY